MAEVLQAFDETKSGTTLEEVFFAVTHDSGDDPG
jgi:hypothetical protein